MSELFVDSPAGAVAPTVPATTPPVDGAAGDTTTAPVSPTETSTTPAPESASDDPVIKQAEKIAQEAIRKRTAQLEYERRQQRRAFDEARAETARLAAERDQLARERDELRLAAGMPRPEDYGMDANAYQAAMKAHFQKEQQGAEQRRQQEAEAARIAQARVQAANLVEQKYAEGRAKFSDFDEVVMNPALPKLGAINQWAWASVMASPRASDLTYYLAKNPGEMYRLGALDPLSASLEVGRLEAKLPSTAKTPSAAPPPPTNVGGNERPAPKAQSEMSYPEFVRDWRKRHSGRQV